MRKVRVKFLRKFAIRYYMDKGLKTPFKSFFRRVKKLYLNGTLSLKMARTKNA